MLSYNFAELLRTIGVSDFSSGELENLENSFKSLLDDRISTRLVKLVGEEDQKLLEKIESSEEMDKFFTERGISIKEIALEELGVFKEQLISNMAIYRGKR